METRPRVYDFTHRFTH